MIVKDLHRPITIMLLHLNQFAAIKFCTFRVPRTMIALAFPPKASWPIISGLYPIRVETKEPNKTTKRKGNAEERRQMRQNHQKEHAKNSLKTPLLIKSEKNNATPRKKITVDTKTKTEWAIYNPQPAIFFTQFLREGSGRDCAVPCMHTDL